MICKGVCWGGLLMKILTNLLKWIRLYTVKTWVNPFELGNR